MNMNIITPYVRRKAGFLSIPFRQRPMLTGPQYIRYYSTKKPLYTSINGRPALYGLSGVAILGIGSLCVNRHHHAEALSSSSSAGKEGKAFNSYGFISLKLRETQDINHNVKRFRFDLPNEDQVTGLTVSSFVLIRLTKPGTEDKFWPSYVFRPYTPVSMEDDVGFLDLIVKKYDSGGASEQIHNLKPGENVQFFGKPISFRKYEPNKVDSISMIAAGSGITPMVQLLRKIMENPDDQTKVHLLYCNSTEQDILLRDQLMQLEQAHGNQFKVTYCLSRPDNSWNGERGRITAEMIKRYLPEASTNTEVYICGPDGFTNLIKGKKGFFGRGKKGLLEQLGYETGQVHAF